MSCNENNQLQQSIDFINHSLTINLLVNEGSSTRPQEQYRESKNRNVSEKSEEIVFK